MKIDIRLGAYEDTLGDIRAKLICTSPPYNIGSKGARKDGRRRFGEYDAKSFGAITGYDDNLPEPEYQVQQAAFLRWCYEHLLPGGTMVYNHKPRRKKGAMFHPMEWILRVPELVLVEEVIWDRGSTHNHSNRMFWPQTERVYILRRREDPYVFINHAGLDFRGDVWRIPRAKNRGHCAPFPEALVRNIVRAYSEPGDLVCDPYTGSGTTAAVCKDLGRRFVGSELLEKYWLMAKERVRC